MIKFKSSVIENNLYTYEELIAIIGFENANSEIDYWGNSQAVEILKIVESQFSELTIKILDIFGDNDMVATRVLYEGIHSGICMGIPATGKKICFEALENFKVVDGKIVESWAYWSDKEIEEKIR